MKDFFLIKGLGGKKTLRGTLPVRGAKNAALPAFAAALLSAKRASVLENIPYIEDVRRIAEMLQELGAAVERTGAHAWKVSPAHLAKTALNAEHAKHMRASIVLAGPLLARMGRVSFPHPGGCVLGERPVDMFLSAFEKMGARVRTENSLYTIETGGKRLRGADIFFHIQSHTATETVLMAATLAEGTTLIKNAAMEPEIENLARFLIACGARIEGAGTPTIRVTGVPALHGGAYRAIPDRIEAGSFLILAALAGEDITVTDCEPTHIESVTETLARSGVPLHIGKHSIRVRAARNAERSPFRAVSVKTHEYPGFPTDLQAPMAIFLTQAEGESQVFETIFDGRLNYAADLITMGADVRVWSPHTLTVKGPTPLRGRELEGPDIRAGLAYILAAVVAKGRSVVNNVHYVDRGYERIEERLAAVGVDMERISN